MSFKKRSKTGATFITDEETRWNALAELALDATYEEVTSQLATKKRSRFQQQQSNQSSTAEDGSALNDFFKSSNQGVASLSHVTFNVCQYIPEDVRQFYKSSERRYRQALWRALSSTTTTVAVTSRRCSENGRVLCCELCQPGPGMLILRSLEFEKRLHPLVFADKRPAVQC